MQRIARRRRLALQYRRQVPQYSCCHRVSRHGRTMAGEPSPRRCGGFDFRGDGIRACLGAHYPRDVLAGLVLGALVSLAGYFLMRPVLRRFLGFADKTRLRRLFIKMPADTTEGVRSGP